MTKATVKAIIPSWEDVKVLAEEEIYPEKPLSPSFTIEIIGATVNIDGGTHIKKNTAPIHSTDYDIRCDSKGNLSGKSSLSNVNCVYIWGYGYTLNGSYYECEPFYDEATKIKVTQNTELVLWGANSE